MAVAATPPKFALACTNTECGAKLKVSVRLMGRKARCPKCKTVFGVPRSLPASPGTNSAPVSSPESRHGRKRVDEAVSSPTHRTRDNARMGMTPRRLVMGSMIVVLALLIAGILWLFRETKEEMDVGQLRSNAATVSSKSEPLSGNEAADVESPRAVASPLLPVSRVEGSETADEPMPRTMDELFEACGRVHDRRDGREALSLLAEVVAQEPDTFERALPLFDAVVRDPEQFELPLVAVHGLLLSQATVPLIHFALGSTEIHRSTRLRLIESLGWNDGASVEATLLLHMTAERDFKMLRAYFAALRNFNTRQTRRALAAVLSSPEWAGKVRLAAAEVLVQFGRPEVDQLLEVVIGKETDPALRKRLNVLRGLARPARQGLLILNVSDLPTNPSASRQIADMAALDLRCGDTVVSCEGQPCTSMKHLFTMASRLAVKREVTLQVHRDGKLIPCKASGVQLMMGLGRIEARFVMPAGKRPIASSSQAALPSTQSIGEF